jgi:translation initiation factor 2-alpha kinase 4
MKIEETDFESAEVSAIYDAIEDIGNLLGGSAQSTSIVSQSTVGESMTGGVGTTFYRAPEQEGTQSNSKGLKGDGSYNVQADIYSLGIILFEMFHPPFDTVRT